ncbi:helix-turn-helix transcriptional regulator [Streptacidiphilus jiangxiensis]|uniref:Predicted DNA-binding transcriptional regulator YafY, contains an HTH and WYL domains n=1 Tax=Streptacidiphilus jiangxiensis TaxID=235985 RepID=A0A1H7KF61_STRJI|nr:YafY family protein [Streptacidiphilus jiangxiensis]SEK85491.1 Predicted DNA-binding transcriptional regulator YafY, contains an HTH and WYL domains [Streptacidiphilus jiangxiensis]
MLETSARLLRLLSLLQSRPDWPGAELASRLGVTTRTIRRDVDRLRDLGYPVESTTGTAGGYRLGVGAALPPLLLDDDEAVAVAVGLRASAAGCVTGNEESVLRALAKLEQMLPARLRYRVSAIQAAVQPLTAPGGPSVAPDLLAALAGACRAHEGVRFSYQGRTRRVEPYRLVPTGRRWYLLAFDLDRDDWRTFRVDRVDGSLQPGARFTPRPAPAEDLNAYLGDRLTSSPYRFQATIRFFAPLEQVAERTSPTAGRLEPEGESTCLFHAGASSLDELAVHVALKGVDFEVLEPPELRHHLAHLAERLSRAASAATRETA